MSELLKFVLEEWRLLLLLFILFLIYFHYTSTFDYFKLKGVPYKKPYIFVGNLGERFFQRTSFHEFNKKFYNQFKGVPYFGLFEGRRPSLVLRDRELIKSVLIRNFENFIDRNTLNSNEPNYMKRSLLNLKGGNWKAVRSSLTPTFSSSRLRNMIPLMDRCSIDMIDSLKEEHDSIFEMKEFWGRYTLDVIGSCAFGIDCSSFKDKDSRFVAVAKDFDKMSFGKRLMLLTLLVIAPKMLRYLNISFMNSQTSSELVRMLSVTKKQRRSSGERRNDFLQILIDTAQKEIKSNNGKTVLDEDTIDAQLLLFLIAGFETSSSLLTFTSYILATHKEIQDKLRQQTKNILEKHNYQLSYECLSDMDYMESVLMETLRVYPPAPRVDRVCTMKCTLPGTNLEINPGDIVIIPIYGIHMDPDNYENPETIIPERFSKEKRSGVSDIFLPFGAGPRNCIGMRFAMISVKVALCRLLMEYEILPSDRTERPVVIDSNRFLLKAKNGVWLHLKKINV